MERTACFDCERMLGLILDAGKALIECGGETREFDSCKQAQRPERLVWPNIFCQI